jgi:hypothetical protein
VVHRQDNFFKTGHFQWVDQLGKNGFKTNERIPFHGLSVSTNLPSPNIAAARDWNSDGSADFTTG